MKPTPELVEIVTDALMGNLSELDPRELAVLAIEAIPVPDHSALVARLREIVESTEYSMWVLYNAQRAADALEGKP